MIKGVNKQIVEINYTKNDYIEKAILIINPNKSGFPKEIISKKADDYMQTILEKGKKLQDKQKNIGIIVILSILLAIMILTIIILIM